MLFRARSFLLMALLCCRWVTATAEDPAVRIATELGDIIVTVDSQHAPVSAANFLRYVDSGMYDAGRFHRTVTVDNQPDKAAKIQVIQAGINPRRQHEEFAPIALERTSAIGANINISLAWFRWHAMGLILRPAISSFASPINPAWISAATAIPMVRGLQLSAVLFAEWRLSGAFSGPRRRDRPSRRP